MADSVRKVDDGSHAEITGLEASRSPPDKCRHLWHAIVLSGEVLVMIFLYGCIGRVQSFAAANAAIEWPSTVTTHVVMDST